jgi:hypothetical protein
LFASISSWSQKSETYLESNLGLSINDELVFPGFSVLWGKRTFQTEKRFVDRQFGLAAPSLVTLKIGQGLAKPQYAQNVQLWCSGMATSWIRPAWLSKSAL